MNNYNRGSRSGGGRYGGGGFSKRDSGRREMHKAVCDECGESCEVPFRPRGDKPIFCSNCFEGKGGRSLKRSGGSGFENRDNTNKQLLEQVSYLNEKLDRILKVVESSVEKKPVSKKTELKKVVKKATIKDEKIKSKKMSKKEAEKSTEKD